MAGPGRRVVRGKEFLVKEKFNVTVKWTSVVGVGLLQRCLSSSSSHHPPPHFIHPLPKLRYSKKVHITVAFLALRVMSLVHFLSIVNVQPLYSDRVTKKGLRQLLM